ncbi:hypothetical protein E3O06_14345 [Cryobacterium glaciale]|uniref:DUF5134 domain-containing protein n=1 Tax=Cryobacterium glaciale TaxID=1259145 RepID=A0A4R8UU68_9MICO|nr:hypothetical protein [Cryobacterium glaciale]TFB70630.1 hypothetical protein E3O06_14345 [Cryobacterium glaciale]
MTIELLHGVMLAGVGVNACCVVGSRRSRSAVTIVSTLLMAVAMLDASFGWLGVAPLAWTALLLAWAMVSAVLLRPRPGGAVARGAVRGGTVLGGTVLASAASTSTLHGAVLGAAVGRIVPGNALHLFHTLGLVVLAAQLTAHSMAGRADAAGTATASAHDHALSLLPVVVAGAGLLFVGYALVLLLATRCSSVERGTLASMGAMTLAMGLMPLL